MILYSMSNFGGDPCAIPTSEECKKHHCPHFWSGALAPIGSADCRRHMRMLRRSAVTTKTELEQQRLKRQELEQLGIRKKRAEEEAKRALATRSEAEKRLAQSEKQLAQQRGLVARNKKILMVGAAVIGFLLVGSFFIKKGE